MADASLHVIDAQGRRVVPLDRRALEQAPFVIGRRSGVDLQLTGPDVSREHAEIRFEGGAFVLRDRGSTFGTAVNGRPVVERRLEPHDHIRLGRSDVELVFVLDGEDAAAGLRAAASDGADLRQLAEVMNGLRALGSGRVLDEVLTLVMDSALEVTRADRGFVMLASPSGALEMKIARGRGRKPLHGAGLAGTSEKIPREVFRTERRQVIADLMDAALADAHGGTIAIGIRHVLCVPLLVAPMGSGGSADGTPRAIGVLYLDGRERSTLLSDSTIRSLEAFATQAALAIESARLYAESAEKAKIDRDLRLAADIQRALLPPPRHQTDWFDLAAVTMPCRTVGGDFYDYLDTVDGDLGFGLGDVAGKGPPAAILAAAVQTTFGALAPAGADPSDTMSRINAALLRRAVDARFATMFHGVLAPDGRLRYCNAGQDPPVLVGAGRVEWLEQGGPVLGLLATASYQPGNAVLEPGDLIVGCSDGVSEALSATGDEFGRDRFLDVVRDRHDQPADVVLAALIEALDAWARGAPRADDVTAVVVRYRGRL